MKHVMKKRFGQNFLTDKNLLQKIVDKASVTDKDVIEVGPGQGALTQFIVKKSQSLTCYEIDYTLKAELESKFSQYENFKLIIDDFLKVDLNINGPHVIIGNIPYYITSPILFKYLEEPNLTEATLMMQKEVGERLLAKPKTKAYNALSVIFQYYTKIEKLLDVKRHLFYPPPKVDSVVIKSTKYENRPKDEPFEHIVKLGFANKRKMLVNNLSQGLNLDKEQIISMITNAKLPATVRAEEMSVEDWILLTTIVFPYL